MINSAKELKEHLNKEFGLTQKWPKEFYVNSETYADCCQEVFNYLVANELDIIYKTNYTLDIPEGFGIRIWLGKNKGLMFKSVELILDRVM